MILKKRKKQGVCLLIAVALTLIMLSCASRSMMPKNVGIAVMTVRHFHL